MVHDLMTLNFYTIFIMLPHFSSLTSQQQSTLYNYMALLCFMISVDIETTTNEWNEDD